MQTTAREAPSKSAILTAARQVMTEATEPLSVTMLSIKVTKALRAENFDLDNRGVMGAEIRQVLDSPTARSIGVVTVGKKRTVGTKQEWHYALDWKVADWNRAATEARDSWEAICRRVDIQDLGGGFRVLVDSNPVASISYAIAAHNGLSAYDAELFAQDIKRTIQLRLRAQAENAKRGL